MKRILFVAFPFSIHTARWLGQLSGAGFDVHLVSSMDENLNLHPDIKGITYHENFFNIPGSLNPGNRYVSFQFFGDFFVNSDLVKKIIRKLFSIAGLRKTRDYQIHKLVKKLKPDIIHSMETQHAGYLVMDVKKLCRTSFPIWVHSNWGVDLHYFSRIASHKEKIALFLKHIDILLVEGNRDEILARQLGFKGLVNTFPSVGGGFQFPMLAMIQPSRRNKILIKGTQNFARRGLVAIRALERCADLLENYEIVLYSAEMDTKYAAELFFHSTGKAITVLDEISHDEMLILNSNARINITINLSDGLPNSMLEAMMMGAFPIQSKTSLADEWIENGITGMLVPPEDPEIIEQAIRKALTEDDMVDKAAQINSERIRELLPYEKIKEKVISFYHEIYTKKLN